MRNNPATHIDKRRYSLSGQLLLWLMICLFTILSISAVVSYNRAYYFANLAYDRAIFRVALALAEQVDIVKDRVVIDLPEIAKNLVEYDKDDLINYRISTPMGETVVGEPNILRPKQVIKSGGHIYYDDILGGEKVRVVAYALPIINSKLKGDLLVQVAETRAKREFMVREIIKEMLIPQILIMLVTALIILFSIKRSLLPLKQLKFALARRSNQDLSPITTDNSPQEIRPLLNEMNALMLRVKEGVDFQKTFIADASHQLRTPISALQNQVELALRGQGSIPMQHALENIAASTRHLSRLVQQLLTLARVEPGTKTHYEFSPVDFTALVQEVTADWVPRALAKGVDLGFEADTEHHSFVFGNAFMLKEMLSNLVENALCYTLDGGEVTVALTYQANVAILQIIDNGIGIAADKRELVFNRFYRIEDNVGEGCGLGLAIVKEIVLAHNASIYITDGLLHAYEIGCIAYGTSITINFKVV